MPRTNARTPTLSRADSATASALWLPPDSPLSLSFTSFCKLPQHTSLRYCNRTIDKAATLPKQFRDPLPAYSRDAARDVQCRTLLIEGEKSPHMFRNNVDKLAGWVDHAEKQTIAGASHGMNVAKPGVFNRLVHAFVSSW